MTLWDELWAEYDAAAARDDNAAAVEAWRKIKAIPGFRYVWKDPVTGEETELVPSTK